MRAFLSHNSNDKPIARSIGSHMVLLGADVWFDEWSIQAGESIPGKLNEGLHSFDVFVLIWSARANASSWVNQELEAAIMLSRGQPEKRIVPVILDETPLPPLICMYRFVDLRVPDSVQDAVQEILGIRADRDFRRALQSAIEDLRVSFRTFAGVGPVFGCPRCGADPSAISQRIDHDPRYEATYAGVQCLECDWSDGGEI